MITGHTHITAVNPHIEALLATNKELAYACSPSFNTSKSVESDKYLTIFT